MRIVAVGAATLALAGCASGLHSQINRVAAVPVTVSEIQRAIACEFQYALQASNGLGREVIGSWSAVVELTLIAKDTSTVTPGLGQMSGKFGNATISTASPLPSMTFDSQVEDQNVLTYVAGIEGQASSASCPAQDSPLASSGLELADLLVGTVQILNSGGSITSSASVITRAGVGPVEGSIISSGTVYPLAAVKEAIPTVKYERGFTVSRKAVGGLSFKVGDVSLTLTGTAVGRDRSKNIIKVTMGPSTGTRASTDQADLDGPIGDAQQISLEDSIFLQRQQEIELLRGLVPDEVIVITPSAAP